MVLEDVQSVKDAEEENGGGAKGEDWDEVSTAFVRP